MLERLWKIPVILCLLLTSVLMDDVRASAEQSSEVAPATADVLPTVAETVLSPTWRFQIGDNARFADAELNDDNWPLLSLKTPDLPLARNTFQIVWYRTHLRVPVGLHDLALSLLNFHTAERVFINGRLVDSWGKQKLGWGRFADSRRLILIPDSVLRTGELTVAIRAAAGVPSLRPLSDETILVLGPASVMRTERSLLSFRYFTSNSIRMGVEAFVLLLALSLAIAMREEKVYILMVILVAVYLTGDAILTFSNVGNWQRSPALFLYFCTDPLVPILLIELVRAMLLQRRIASALRLLYWFIGATCLAWWINGLFVMYGHFPPQILRTFLGTVFELVLDLPIAGLAAYTLWFAIRHRSRETFLVSIPLFVEAGLSLTIFLHYEDLGPNLFAASVPITTFSVKWFEVSRIFLCLTLLVVLILRTMRIAKERGVTAGELDAAQTVQRLLLDSSSIATPGFFVETAYMPASQVGGDFYYVSPATDGSLLVVFGDVSGKGLHAAMTVSAIMGALRNEGCRTPSTVLKNLNKSLHGHMEGFATCCAALLEASGLLTLANAGNPAPYLNGRELEAVPGLPLGLLPDADYHELSEIMPAGWRLLFASDGVIEATNPKSGELFGFERTAALAHHSAGAVAQAAQSFGQTDDISVLVVGNLVEA